MDHNLANGNGSRAVRVLLASASSVRRAGLESLVKSAPALKVAGSLQGTHTIAERAVELQPDVILADLDKESSLLLGTPSGFPLVLLIDDPDSLWTAQALRSGVKAVLPRDAGIEEILPAILAAFAGLVLLDPQVAQNLVQGVRSPASPMQPPHEDLTPREIEVLAMLAEGLGNRQIADRMGVSDHTIKFHISSILDKLGASTRTEAVTLGLRMGLILL